MKRHGRFHLVGLSLLWGISSLQNLVLERLSSQWGKDVCLTKALRGLVFPQQFLVITPCRTLFLDSPPWITLKFRSLQEQGPSSLPSPHPEGLRELPSLFPPGSHPLGRMLVSMREFFLVPSYEARGCKLKFHRGWEPWLTGGHLPPSSHWTGTA